MKLSIQTIKKLAEIIDTKPNYRSGPELVEFFNLLGFHDSYYSGFPSRHIYTENNIQKLNGTSGIDECIKAAFAPINFIDSYDLLNELINDFNKHLSYDGWNIFVSGKEISFKRANFDVTNLYNQDFGKEKSKEDFLNIKIENLNISKLPIEPSLVPIIEQRITEIEQCIKYKISFSAIFLCGSVLEGIFLGLATKNPIIFNTAKASPKDKAGKVKQFSDWTLKNYIEVAKELGYIDLNVQKFSHVVQDFRNYIHPYQQLAMNFTPDIETAKLCVQVLKIAINQLSGEI